MQNANNAKRFAQKKMKKSKKKMNTLWYGDLVASHKKTCKTTDVHKKSTNTAPLCENIGVFRLGVKTSK